MADLDQTDETQRGVKCSAIRGMPTIRPGPLGRPTGAIQSLPPIQQTPLSLAAHILCCMDWTQNRFAQLVEPRLEVAATSFGVGIGELAGGAFDGGYNFSATTEPRSITVSPALGAREVCVQEEAKLSRSVAQAAAIACSEVP